MSYSSSGIIQGYLAGMKSDPLSDAIQEYYQIRSKSENRLGNYNVPFTGGNFRPPGRISPSSIKGCKRKAVLSFVAAPSRRIIDPTLERIFSRGHWTHHEWQATFLDMERVLGPDRFRVHAIEARMSIPKFFIKGRLDADIEVNGQRMIVDFKSARMEKYTQRVAEGKPEEAHLDQIITYQRGSGVLDGAVLYDDKNGQRHSVFMTPFDKDRWKKIVRWTKRVIGYLEDRQLPPMDENCTKGSFMQRGCPFANLCYGTKTDTQMQTLAFGGRRARFKGPEDWWRLGHQMEERHARSSRESE